MIRQITTEKLPINLWLDDLEPGAWEQARNLANYPFAFGHVALMPDCHQGFGMPIGGVMATREVVVPNAVGVDIGCGMSAVRTSLESVSRSVLKRIVARIRASVPVGFKHHRQARARNLMPSGLAGSAMPVVRREYEHALHQLGTLGGGNHFIEVQQGTAGRIWLMVHSGSRNLGKQVADHYNRLAVKFNDRDRNLVPRSMQLAYLPLASREGGQYLREMNYCIEFAGVSRRLMMKAAVTALEAEIGACFELEPMIDIAHNYAAFETHSGVELLVHRKGATKAFRDTTGIIPGSQGASSFIVRGKGNPESFSSCSHGAGRLMGRKQAIRSLDLAIEREKLEGRGILHSLDSRNQLDEAAGAYKDIDQVMENQQDLVEILFELHPLAVVKG